MSLVGTPVVHHSVSVPQNLHGTVLCTVGYHLPFGSDKITLRVNRKTIMIAVDTNQRTARTIIVREQTSPLKLNARETGFRRALILRESLLQLQNVCNHVPQSLGSDQQVRLTARTHVKLGITPKRSHNGQSNRLSRGVPFAFPRVGAVITCDCVFGNTAKLCCNGLMATRHQAGNTVARPTRLIVNRVSEGFGDNLLCARKPVSNQLDFGISAGVLQAVNTVRGGISINMLEIVPRFCERFPVIG